MSKIKQPPGHNIFFVLALVIVPISSLLSITPIVKVGGYLCGASIIYFVGEFAQKALDFKQKNRSLTKQEKKFVFSSLFWALVIAAYATYRFYILGNG